MGSTVTGWKLRLNEMKIREAGLEDIEYILKTGDEEEEFRVKEDGVFWKREQLERWIKSTEDVTLIVKEDGEPAGYILVAVHKPTEKATIENIYVDKKHRNSKIGTALIEECKTVLKEKGCKFICALVEKDNNPSLNLFKSEGFIKGKEFRWLHLDL